MRNPDFDTTETTILNKGYSQLSGKELKERISGKTIRGDYYNGRKYITFFDKNENMEGKNDIGSHVFGTLSINMNDNTLTVKRDTFWDDWTGRAYDVDGEIKFYGTTTFKWKTTLKRFEDGK